MARAERNFNVSAKKLVEATIAQARWQYTLQEERGIVPYLTVEGRKVYDLLFFWEHAGASTRAKIGRQKYLFKCPEIWNLGAALNEQIYGIRPDGSTRAAPMPDDDAGTRWMEFFGATDEEAATVKEGARRAVTRFEQLPEEEQPFALEEIRRILTTSVLHYLFYKRRGALAIEFPLEQWFAPPGASMSDEWKQRREYAEHVKRIEVVLAEAGIFFELVDWNKRTHCLPEGQQILPPGYWPTGEAQEAQAHPAVDEQLELGEAMAGDDMRVDQARDEYYMNVLGCVSRLESQGWFSTRQYVVYVYRGANEEVAIADCKAPGNAAYLFRMGKPEEGQPDAWKNDAVQTKFELLTRPDNQKGTFVRRFIHAAGWGVRLAAFMRDNFGVCPAHEPR